MGVGVGVNLFQFLRTGGADKNVHDVRKVRKTRKV